MRYFKGTSGKKSSRSPRIKDGTSASKTAVDSSGNGQIQRKRPHTANNAEAGQTKSPKRSKEQSSLASSSHGNATNKSDQPVLLITGNKRRKQVIPAPSFSSSESEGSSHLSDQSDSLHVTGELGELGEQSDQKFLQQQIKILKMPFEFEKDCPALSRIKANDSNHIPLQVIHNTLRKVNHKTEDGVLRSLNRLAQRKLLDSLSAVRPEISNTTTAISDEQLKRYKEVQSRVADLEKAHNEMIQEHAQCEAIGSFVSQLEAVSKEFSKKDLMNAIQKANDFLASSSPLTTKTQDLNSINAGARPGVDASDHIPSTHKQLVQILFKD